MREIDGSHGEGGGQLIRTAVALAAISGTEVSIRNVRARRANPGLAAQHVAAVRAVAALCDAQVNGLQVGSQELTFRPGRLHGGRFQFDVGTAGSLTLVLQAVLPAAAACGEPVHLRLTGGTDVKAAPPLDYLCHVLLALLARMGLQTRVTLLRRGYYPRGGGEIETEILPVTALHPLLLDTPGPLEAIHGTAHIANLPGHIVERMRLASLQELTEFADARIEGRVLGRDEAIGQGGAVVLWAKTANTLLGAATVAERGVPAERLGEEAGRALRAEIQSGATLDIHTADQMLIYLAMAQAPSCFLVRTLSTHAQTTIWLLEQFLPVHFTVTPVGELTRVDVYPSAT